MAAPPARSPLINELARIAVRYAAGSAATAGIITRLLANQIEADPQVIQLVADLLFYGGLAAIAMVEAIYAHARGFFAWLKSKLGW